METERLFAGDGLRFGNYDKFSLSAGEDDDTEKNIPASGYPDPVVEIIIGVFSRFLMAFFRFFLETKSHKNGFILNIRVIM